jgi:hypothetical protein
LTDFTQITDKPTLYKAVDDDRLRIEIGGSTDYFAPSVNMSFKLKSDSEKYFLNICDDEEQVKTDKVTETFDKDLISVKVGDVESTFKSIDNSLKIERIFYTKPTEVVKYKLAFSKGVEFLYQGELTTEEIKDGRIRPDNVVGSYAIYCDKANHIQDKSGNTVVNYGCGKLGHLYAPYWFDAKGSEIKGTQELIGNTLTFALPSEKWLDNAAYPIRLDPTLGAESAGASEYYNQFGYALATHYTATEDGTATEIGSYVRHTSGSTRNIKLTVYDNDAGGPNNRLDPGTVIACPTGTDNQISGSFSLSFSSGDKLWLASLPEAFVFYVAYDSGSAGDRYRESINSYTFPAVWGSGAQSGGSERSSHFLTYTADGGGSTLLPIMFNHYNKNIGT